MFEKYLFTIAALALILTTGCRGSAPHLEQNSIDDELVDRSISQRSVLTSEQLNTEYGSILDTMMRKLPGFRADTRFSCPAISLRGRPNTVPGVTEPLVYVNGVQAIDTCILSHLSSSRSEEHTSELQSRGHLVCL